MNRKVKLHLREFHEHLTCYLCGGYFIDATTVIECLHSFCRTCIVNYLNDCKSCPKCHVQIHKTRPLLNIRHDHTLQDIVYKLVPELRANEMQRRRKFWSSREDLELWKGLTPEDLGEIDQRAWTSRAGKICLSLEPHESNSKLSPLSEWSELERSMTKRYLRCCYDVTIYHLQKFVKIKLKEKEEAEVLIFLAENILPQHFSLSDVVENFPCPLRQTLELTFGTYVGKSLKRKLDSKVNSAIVTTQKKRCLPSATPQLQAFFNSQISLKCAKAPVTSKLEKEEKPMLTAVVTSINNETFTFSTGNLKLSQPAVDAKDVQVGVIVKAVDQQPKVFVEPNKQNTNPENKNEKKPDDFIKSKKENSSQQEALYQSDVQTVVKPPNQIAQSEEVCKDVPTKEDNIVSHHELLQHNTVLTPNPELKQIPNSNFVQIQPKPAIEMNSRNQKPSENVQCYTMLNIPVDEAVRRKPPTPVEIPNFPAQLPRPESLHQPFVYPKSVSDSNEVKQSRNRRKPINPSHHSRQPPHPEIEVDPPLHTDQTISKERHDKFRIPSNQRSGQFILLTPPNICNSSGLSKPESPNVTKTVSSRNYEKLNDAQAHRVALDAVRNTMGGVKLQEKRPVPQKRPILPKASTSALSRQNMASPSASRAKSAIAKRQTEMDNLKRLRDQQTLLSQVMAASKKPEKGDSMSEVTSRSGPPPPYHIVGNMVSSSQTKTPTMSLSDSLSQITNRNSPIGNTLPGPTSQGQVGSHAPKPTNVVGPIQKQSNSLSPAVHQHLPRTLMSNQAPARAAIQKRHKPDSTHSPVLNITQPRDTALNQMSQRHVPPTSASNQSVTASTILSPPNSVSNFKYTNQKLLNSSMGRSIPPGTQALARGLPMNQHAVRSVNNSQGALRSAGSTTHFYSNVSPSRNELAVQNHLRTTASTQNHMGNLGNNHNQVRYMPANQSQVRSSAVHSQSNLRTALHNPNHVRNSAANDNRLRVSASPSRGVIRQTNNGPIPRGVKNLLSAKPNILRHSRSDRKDLSNVRKPSVEPGIAIPPTGTKSPWSCRSYPLPDPESASDIVPLLEKARPNTPPPAHQHHSTFQQTYSNYKPQTPSTTHVTEMPLELTSKSRKTPVASLSWQPKPQQSRTTQDDSQPLCLVMKKAKDFQV